LRWGTDEALAEEEEAGELPTLVLRVIEGAVAVLARLE
jgi:hypothetical protein